MGGWAEYLVRRRGEQDVRVRFAVVPPAVDARHAWIEVATVGSQSLPFAARLLVNLITGAAERGSVYALGQAPIELPTGDASALGIATRPRQRVRTRKTKIAISAGTFDTDELRISQGGISTRVWRSDQVPLWGLVRAERSGQTVELLRYGSEGARSVFPHGNGSESANE
jgi:hypothetical protein